MLVRARDRRPGNRFHYIKVTNSHAVAWSKLLTFAQMKRCAICGAPSPLAREQQAIANRHERRVHAAVGENFLGQGADGDGSRIRRCRIESPSAHEDIVDGDHASRPYQYEALLVITVVLVLVGIDEGEVVVA